MKTNFDAAQLSDQGGYVLLGVIMLMVVSLVVIGGALDISATGARTVHATKVRSIEYLDAEASIGRALSWMRANSQRLITPFRREEFYTRFDRTAPTNGINDSSHEKVPTLVKLDGTFNGAILANDPSLASAAFPLTLDVTTNVVFAAETNFSAADLGNALVRVTLVDAIADDPLADYGDLPNPEPETDFSPVYRIDAMTDTNQGAHVYAYVSTDIAHVFDFGIYGEDHLEIRQPCDSYVSSAGPYSTGSRLANCPAASNSTSQIHKTEAVYGSLRTNGSVNEGNPFGGHVCSDFVSGCPNKGVKCAGEDCGVPLLEQFDAWLTYCPSDQGSPTLSSDTTLVVGGALPSQKCWGTVTVQNNVTLTLESTNEPYFIHTLDLQNNSNSRFDINPNPAGGIVELYVHTIVGDSFNGNQSINTAGRPYNFRMYYLGTNALTLNGNADMNIALVAPNAEVTISGSFEFHGALLAKELLLTGSGGVHYDESLSGSGPINDIQFQMQDIAQFYR